MKVKKAVRNSLLAYAEQRDSYSYNGNVTIN
jgi:hypothetical protein